MATTTLHAGAYVHNNSTILGAGNIIDGQANSLSLADNNTSVSKQDTLPVSGTNMGVIKSIADRQFNKQTDEFVGMIICNSIAGAEDNTLRSGAGDFGQDIPGYWPGYNRIDVSIDAETGVVTKGGNDGAAVLPSGVDGVTGKNADHELTTNGEWVFMVTGKTPTQNNY